VTGHRHQYRRHQTSGFQAGVVAQPMPQRHVYPVAPHVHQSRSRLDPHLDLRMPLIEVPQARHQPGRGKGGDGTDRQGLAPLDRLQRVDGLVDLRKGVEQRRMDAASVRRKPCLCRVNSAIPSRSSSNRICWLTAPEVTCRASAAALMLPRWPTSTKVRSACKGCEVAMDLALLNIESKKDRFRCFATRAMMA